MSAGIRSFAVPIVDVPIADARGISSSPNSVVRARGTCFWPLLDVENLTRRSVAIVTAPTTIQGSCYLSSRPSQSTRNYRLFTSSARRSPAALHTRRLLLALVSEHATPQGRQAPCSHQTLLRSLGNRTQRQALRSNAPSPPDGTRLGA